MPERCLKRTRGLITIQLCKEDGDNAVIEAKDARGGLVARANFVASELDGKPIGFIGAINTVTGARRAGIGTAVYELAFEHACATGRRLTSDVARSEWAEAFWRKQRKKGRAQCIKTNKGAAEKNYYAGPRASLEQDARDACTRRFKKGRRVETCVKKLLRDATKRLPKPKDGAWPCARFGIKRSLCKGSDFKLDGATPKRTRTRSKASQLKV